MRRGYIDRINGPVFKLNFERRQKRERQKLERYKMIERIALSRKFI